jgi:hypothetical protein
MRIRQWNRLVETDLKHSQSVIAERIIGRSTRNGGGTLNINHAMVLKGQRLMFVGYELQVMKEDDIGYGLKTTVDIKERTHITQYEVSVTGEQLFYAYILECISIGSRDDKGGGAQDSKRSTWKEVCVTLCDVRYEGVCDQWVSFVRKTNTRIRYMPRNPY